MAHVNTSFDLTGQLNLLKMMLRDNGIDLYPVDADWNRVDEIVEDIGTYRFCFDGPDGSILEGSTLKITAQVTDDGVLFDCTPFYFPALPHCGVVTIPSAPHDISSHVGNIVDFVKMMRTGFANKTPVWSQMDLPQDESQMFFVRAVNREMTSMDLKRSDPHLNQYVPYLVAKQWAIANGKNEVIPVDERKTLVLKPDGWQYKTPLSADDLINCSDWWYEYGNPISMKQLEVAIDKASRWRRSWMDHIFTQTVTSDEIKQLLGTARGLLTVFQSVEGSGTRLYPITICLQQMEARLMDLAARCGMEDHLETNVDMAGDLTPSVAISTTPVTRVTGWRRYTVPLLAGAAVVGFSLIGMVSRGSRGSRGS